MSEPVRVINLRSRKGGVGKTTLALAIAADLLAEGPVVLVDADILGTEVVDMVPYADRSGQWPLGLLDLLTASVGGNHSFGPWLAERLGTEPLPGMPRLAIGGGAHELIVLPSHRWRDPELRARDTEGIGLQLLVLDFAREQVARRLLALLAGIVEQWRPAAVVIDNSPLHAGLARLTSELPATPPAGLAREHERLFNGTTPLLRWYELEVVGPDLQDLFHFFSFYERCQPEAGVHRGWILNRHSHFKASEIRDDDHPLNDCQGCALVAEADMALRPRLLQDPAVLHAGISWLMSVGTTARYFETEEWPPTKAAFRPRTAPADRAAAIRESLTTLTLSRGDAGATLRKVDGWGSWLQLLDGTGTP